MTLNSYEKLFWSSVAHLLSKVFSLCIPEVQYEESWNLWIVIYFYKHHSYIYTILRDCNYSIKPNNKNYNSLIYIKIRNQIKILIGISKIQMIISVFTIRYFKF